MCSFPSSSLSLITHNTSSPSLFRPRNLVSIFISSNPLRNQLKLRQFPFDLSPLLVPGRRNASNLLSYHSPSNDDYAGWASFDAPFVKQKKGLPTFAMAGIGSSIAILAAVIAYLSLSNKGFKLRFSNAFNGLLSPSRTEDSLDSDDSGGDFSTSEAISNNVSAALGRMPESENVEMVERVIVPIAMDTTQQEALSVLRKLKVIEDDVKEDELCTRKAYARWLVRANSLLERNPKYRLLPSALLSGSSIVAFNDVGVEDPDFGPIQALAEAGVIRSKLAWKSSSDLDSSEGHKSDNFFPDSFISRQDLIDWKAQLDYKLKSVNEEEILRVKASFMDMREISTDASPGFFMDVLASDKGILRKVFGRLKRFQPNKPSTIAQAAVALTGGRMTKAIQAELSRLEAENNLKQITMFEIKSELLETKEIEKVWDPKLKEEKTCLSKLEKAYQEATYDVQQEEIIQEKSLVEFSKEKAAIEIQRQLINSIKNEIDEMTARIEREKGDYEDTEHNVKDILSDLLTKQEGLVDKKSLVEAEKEALQILRSWVEDEAKKSEARVKVLEDAIRRWRWSESRQA